MPIYEGRQTNAQPKEGGAELAASHCNLGEGVNRYGFHNSRVLQRQARLDRCLRVGATGEEQLEQHCSCCADNSSTCSACYLKLEICDTRRRLKSKKEPRHPTAPGHPLAVLWYLVRECRADKRLGSTMNLSRIGALGSVRQTGLDT